MYFPTRIQIGAALLVASLSTFARASDDVSTIRVAPSPLYLTVFTDVAGGTVLLKGEHEAAIAEIRGTKPTHSAVSLPITNLCAAQIVAHAWEAARPTCDSAVDAALRDRVRAPSQPFSARNQYKDFVAIAYSNRAVLRLLASDMRAGEDDLVRAQKVAPRAKFVQRNLDATKVVREARVLAQSTER